MKNNRKITIYTATNRKSKRLQKADTSVQALFQKLGTSQTIPHTRSEYAKLSKAQQSALKDTGAYIAGTLKDGRRKNGFVLTRCAAVLDADNLARGDDKELLQRLDALGWCYCVHSTAKHSGKAPRLRVVLPLAEDITAEQYAPVVRLLCQQIQPDMTWFDPSTDEAGRLMFYPAHCSDVTPVYETGGKALLDATALLQRLPDWTDVTTWPCFPREQPPAEKAAKQADPTEKDGIVGAFCRVYDVPAAMDKFLPGVYEGTVAEGRYTFTGGSTSGGAVIYEGGRFIFSHHATDPAGGKLCNAFDLVRLHRYGHLDDDAKDGARGNRLPSYEAMSKLALDDPAVAGLLAKETLTAAAADFADDAAPKLGFEYKDGAAAAELVRRKGDRLTTGIMRLTLKALGIRVQRNVVTGRIKITGMPPAYSAEQAVNTLPVLLQDVLQAVDIKGISLGAIISRLAVIQDEDQYNPVQDMLDGTAWDGSKRFPELLRLLGIPDGDLSASLVRKWLIQCVALAHNTPEYREAAEGVLTLQGGQGIGKTLFFRRLAINSDWFAEGVSLDLKNKDDVIRATGAWITELGELDSTLKREQANLKAFITMAEDRIRAPYAREYTNNPRHTSFCATVNPTQFLKDDTGDRRFWVVPVDNIALRVLVSLPGSWFVQLWAEAMQWWKTDPRGFRLTKEEREELDRRNTTYREPVLGELEILDAFNENMPADQWPEWTAAALRDRLFTGRSIDARQIGRTLSKLAREDQRIRVRCGGGHRRYYTLPIENWNDAQEDFSVNG